MKRQWNSIKRATLGVLATLTVADGLGIAAAQPTGALAHPSGREQVDGVWVTHTGYGGSWRGSLSEVDNRVSDGSRVEYFRFQGNRGD